MMEAAPGLADPIAIAARREAEQRYAARLLEAGPLAELRRRLQSLGDTADAPALVAAAEPLLADIGWLGEAIRAAARAAAQDPWFEPPLRTVDPARQLGLVFHDDRRLRLSAQALPLERIAAYKASGLGARSIGFTGTLTAYRVIRAAGTMLDLWAADPVGDIADVRDRHCRRAGQLALRDGMTFTIDGTREAWTIAAQSGDPILLQASARFRHAPLAIEYDAGTGAFRSASDTDGSVARMQLMATLLREMKRRDAAPVLAGLIDGAPFNLRWHLARELTALDPALAAGVLRRLAEDDPHAEVRVAARQTLAAIAA